MTSRLNGLLIGKIAWVFVYVLVYVLLNLFPGSIGQAVGQSQKASGIKVPDGFEVTQVATDDLANNIFSLAVSPSGQTFVTGPGYIKILVDSDGDRVFDSTQTYATLPRSGAQGICFDGNDLFCTGDGALLKFTDADNDGISDGPPVRLFSIKTGGEHDAHSIRKGPDGFWYLLAGNGVPISKEFYASPDSPVKNPRAGFLMRISPDWSEKQIYCHGFRNAYDFDFNSLGEVFVFDSDGERDVSLPWYRPTRVFRMRPGDDAGFVKQSWKRPSVFFDMPPELGALGRGSPTGVVVGHSNSFPIEFEDGVFVADWTFGRVVAFKRDTNGDYDRGTDFAVASGQFGFAVTDLDFDKDGSLLISVGGRGTQGGVYRVSFVGTRGKKSVEVSKQWEATKRFITRAKTQSATVAELIESLESSDARRRECAFEALLIDASKRDFEDSKLVAAVAVASKQLTPRELVLLARLMPVFDIQSQQAILEGMEEAQAAIVSGVYRSAGMDGQADLETLELVLKTLSRGTPDTVVTARLGQLAIGGCGATGEPAMFVGYWASKKLEIGDSDRQRYSGQLAQALRTAADQEGKQEIGRLAAMLEVGSEELRSAMAGQLMSDSTVPQDIHWLNCISRTLRQRGGSDEKVPSDVRTKLADTLVGIGGKLTRDNLNNDRNFYPRLKTLTASLFKNLDPEFATEVVQRMAGVESEVFLFESLPRPLKLAKQKAREKFAFALKQSPESATSAQLNVLVGDSSGEYLELIRSFANRREFRGLVIKAISSAPAPQDRQLLLSGLSSPELGTVKNSAIGLRRIFDRPRPIELVASIAAARRLGWDKPSVSVRDQLMLLVTKHDGVTAGEIGYQQKSNELNQSEVLDRWEKWVSTNHPQQYESAFGDVGPVDWKQAKTKIDSIAWDSGDAARGHQLYKKFQCAACHDGGSRLGPKLEGISKRFSRDDIFKSILLPDQQVPQRYRALLIETVDGKFYRGSQVYESADGITLQQTDGTTVRINKQDIEDRVLSAKSLMPADLLKGSSDQDWADLYKYLIAK